MLDFLSFCGVGLVSYIIGVFGFAQIIGSLRNIRIRGIALTLFTCILWLAILVGAAAIVLCWIKQHEIALYIAYGISFLSIVSQKKFIREN